MMTRPLRAVVAGLAAIILSMALAAQPAFADDDDSLAIFDATVDDGAGEITIGGQGFPDDPMVTFDGAAATIVGPTSETEIVIELPDGTPPGSYRIAVGEWEDTPECFDDDTDCFEVAVGAVGPDGPEGPQGDPGAIGPTGIVGVTVPKVGGSVAGDSAEGFATCSTGSIRLGCSGGCGTQASAALILVITEASGVRGCRQLCVRVPGSSGQLEFDVSAYCT